MCTRGGGSPMSGPLPVRGAGTSFASGAGVEPSQRRVTSPHRSSPRPTSSRALAREDGGEGDDGSRGLRSARARRGWPLAQSRQPACTFRLALRCIADIGTAAMVSAACEAVGCAEPAPLRPRPSRSRSTPELRPRRTSPRTRSRRRRWDRRNDERHAQDPNATGTRLTEQRGAGLRPRWCIR